MKSDCNLTLYHNDKSIWSSNTADLATNCSALLLDNGRFLIRGLNENGIPIVIWDIPINGPEGKYILAVQGDGHVIIYGPDRWTIPEEPKNRKKIAMSKIKRVTRVELNRRARRKEQLKAEQQAEKMSKLSKEIDSLPDIMTEITKEDEEKKRRLIRRTVAKQERLKSAPPRLGKHKFEPAPVQVLLTEEISGSLRKLKGCCTLVKDRYKSLEKRGLLVPRAKGSRKRK
ncbi:ribosome biogenesis protein NOP53-like [Curcuma longa]|uniref:ribosome biogenesis protein NOP53-like n=1 Tax=Curcuma longa TaxID=136217 RepID=UPI003D9ED09B